MTRKLLMLLVALALAAVACGGDEATSDTTGLETTAPTTGVETTATTGATGGTTIDRADLQALVDQAGDFGDRLAASQPAQDSGLADTWMQVETSLEGAVASIPEGGTVIDVDAEVLSDLMADLQEFQAQFTAEESNLDPDLVDTWHEFMARAESTITMSG